MIAGQALEFLGRLRAGVKGTQLGMITAQEQRQDLGVEGVTLGAAHAEAIAGPIQALGVDGVDNDSVIQQKVDDAPMRPLDGGPDLDPLGLALAQPPAPLASGRDRMGDRATQHLVPRVVRDPHHILLVCPVHTDVVAHGPSSSPVKCEAWSANSRFALYRSSSGPLPIEPLGCSLVGRDSLSQTLRGMGQGGSSTNELHELSDII